MSATRNLGDLQTLVRRYRERIEVRVAERDGGRFDIALEVDGLEVGYIDLLSGSPFGVFRGVDPKTLMASGKLGPVALPE